MESFSTLRGHERDVVEDRHVREEVVGLEDDADVAPEQVHVDLLDL